MNNTFNYCCLQCREEVENYISVSQASLTEGQQKIKCPYCEHVSIIKNVRTETVVTEYTFIPNPEDKIPTEIHHTRGIK